MRVTVTTQTSHRNQRKSALSFLALSRARHRTLPARRGALSIIKSSKVAADNVSHATPIHIVQVPTRRSECWQVAEIKSLARTNTSSRIIRVAEHLGQVARERCHLYVVFVLA